MRPPAVRALGLGKRYRLGGPPRGYQTLSERLARPLAWRRSGAETAGQRRQIWALRDASFTIEHGEVVGIIGPNGSGKSTLLKILSRITEPTEGRAEVHGRVGSLLEVGTGFHPELTGRENVHLNGAVLGMRRPEIEAKFDDIVHFAGVADFLDTPVKRYSSGMYVRLAFAVAAHLEPEILLVDEVLAVGDHQFQQKCLGKMSSVAREGRTVLFVSHNMDAIARLTDRCLFVRQGRVVRDGPTPEVVAAYMDTVSRTDGAGVHDLRDIRRKYDLGGDLQLLELRLADAEGRPRGRFAQGQPIHLELHLEVKRPIHQFELAFTIATRGGSRLFSIATNRRPWSASPGRYRLTTAIDPNFLRPGVYNVHLGLHSATWQDGGYDLASVEVIPDPRGAASEVPSHGDFGTFLFPYRWSDPEPLDAASHARAAGAGRTLPGVQSPATR